MKVFMALLFTASIQAGFLISGILLLQALFGGRLSPRLSYALWLLPALRLLIPFSIESTFDFMNVALPLGSSAYSATTESPAAASVALQMTTTILPAAMSHPPEQAVPIIQAVVDWPRILFWIWLVGAVLMLAYMLAVNLCAYVQIRRSSTPLKPESGLRVCYTDCIPAPCLFGLFRPCILVNDIATSNPGIYAMTVAHEFAHYRQGDHFWALIRNLCNAVYWFHPLVWVGVLKSRHDCELACDASVMRGFSQAQREAYGMALIAMIQEHPSRHSFVSISTAMMDGKRELKQRIQKIGMRSRISAVMTGLALLLASALFLFACTKQPEDTTAAGLTSPAPAQTMPAPSVQPVSSFVPMPTSSTYGGTDNSKQIAEIQNRLMKLGYLTVNEPSENYDEDTKHALQLFQLQHGLLPDGVLGDQTYDMLCSSKAQPFKDDNYYSTDLESAVSTAIKITYANAFARGVFASEAHTILRVNNQGDTITVYVFAAYGVYDFVEDAFTQVGGTGAIPLKIVLTKGPKGYSVVDVERPKDGAQYHPSIERLFPKDLHEQALNHSEDYVLLTRMQQSRAVAWFVQNGYDIGLLEVSRCNPEASREAIVKTAKMLLEKPYSFDGKGPDSYNCSGLLRACLISAGEWVPEGNCEDIAAYEGWKKIADYADVQAGDLLFFTGADGTIQHGGICIGGNKFIHASSSNSKVTATNYYSGYWKAHFAFARRPSV